MDRDWTIGQLAAATGLTVRALRHYEQIGLLRPARRTSAGHRIYDRRQVERLYLIRALKDLGVPLSQIAELLRTEAFRDILLRHLEHLDHEARRIESLRSRLRRLIAHLDEPLPSDQLVALIEAMTQLEQFFTTRQLDRLAARRAARGPDGAQRAHRNWADLAELLQRSLDAGTSPSAPGVLLLAQRARDYLDAFTGGDQPMDRALGRMRHSDPPDGLAGWTPELARYLDQALEALARHKAARSAAPRNASRS